MDDAEKIFALYLERHGRQLTARRRAILQAVYAAGRHVSAADIYNAAKEAVPGIGIATVWRTLRLLRKAGLVEEHYSGDSGVFYEKRSSGDHGHLICTECGRTVEFKAGDIMPQLHRVSRAHNLEVVTVELSVFCTCRSCSRKSRSISKRE